MTRSAGASLPPTRWELGGAKNVGYGARFAELVADGSDVDGEARLADTLVPRGARVLDAGSGMGRVAAALQARGHRVIAAEPDPELVAQSRATYPDVVVMPAQILELDGNALAAAGGSAAFDLIVCVGNVLTFTADGTEVAVLVRLRELLAPDGRILAGFHLSGGPASARDYRPEAFLSDLDEAGLRVQHRFGGYDLRPADDEYAVWVLTAD